jgi:hypothetical protein
MLNAILPGHTEPVYVTDKLLELGVHATNDLPEAVRLIQAFV